jgi:hypothetical protein
VREMISPCTVKKCGRARPLASGAPRLRRGYYGGAGRHVERWSELRTIREASMRMKNRKQFAHRIDLWDDDAGGLAGRGGRIRTSAGG